MIEFAHFVHFLSFSIGLVAIYISVTLNKGIQSKALKTYTLILVGINFIIFIHILEAFFKTIISDEFYDLWFRPVFWYMIIPLAAVRIWIANRFIYFVKALENRAFSNWYNYLFAAIFVLYAVWLIRPNSENGIIQLNAYSVIFVHLILFLSLCYGALVLIRKSKSIGIINSGWVRRLGWFFLIYAVILFLLRLSNFPVYRMDEDVQMLGLGFLALAFNLLNALFFKKVFMPKKVIKELEKSELFEKNKITKREQEIIAYICQGKTNKQIAEELFITPVTVRDHLSSIYKKVNVNNRTQLAAMFNR